MTIKTYKPITPGLRQRVIVKEESLWKGKGIKQLQIGKISSAGRNNTGRITVYHRGGGHKRKIRIVDNKRENGTYSISQIVRFEYDPNRSGYLAVCKTNNSKEYYILAAEGMKVGDRILGRASKVTGNTTENSINNLSTAANIGKAIEIEKIPVGSIIYNVEIRPRQGGKIARAAGVYCEILKIENGKAVIRLPSKRIITISSSCIASLGRVSNRAHNLTVLGKAGVSRWLGIRPRVKGVKMNPCDHPHGGKTPVSGGKGGAIKTKWGKLAKWRKTRNK